jgi:hypothetical protein
MGALPASQAGAGSARAFPGPQMGAGPGKNVLALAPPIRYNAPHLKLLDQRVRVGEENLRQPPG